MNKIYYDELNRISYKEIINFKEEIDSDEETQFDKEFNEKNKEFLDVIADLKTFKRYGTQTNSPYETETNILYNIVKNIKENYTRQNISGNQEDEYIPRIVELEKSPYYSTLKFYNLIQLSKDYLLSIDKSENNVTFQKQIFKTIKDYYTNDKNNKFNKFKKL